MKSNAVLHAHKNSKRAMWMFALLTALTLTVLSINQTLASTHNQTSNIIVFFESAPTEIQVLEAQSTNQSLTHYEARQITEDNHALFRMELAQMFASLAPGKTYTITAEFRHGFNGVAITLPSNLLDAVYALRSVSSVYQYTEATSHADAIGYRHNPPGMAQGRNSMGADRLHSQGFAGEGVVVAVIDTGIDWMHPAFAGSFPTIADMQKRNPAITDADGININGTYYFVGRDFVHHWQEQASWGNPSYPIGGNGNIGNNPMETSPVFFPASNPASWTSHGTHVAGTIVGRETESEMAIRGIAPAATAFHYRVFAGRAWNLSILLMAVEQIAYDKPDVVNMSLGVLQASSLDVITVAINNIMLANPGITFVLSAGNSGPAFMTNTAPAGSSMAITVAALEEPTFTRLNLNIGNLTLPLEPLVENFVSGWHLLDNGRIIDLSPNLRHENGEIRIFALPYADSPGGGADGTEHLGIGTGTAAQFTALAAEVGDAMRGAYVLVARATNTGAFTAVRAAHAQALQRGVAGVIVVNGTGYGEEPIPFHGNNWDDVATGFMISNACGSYLLEALTNYQGSFTISHTGDLTPLRVADFSSRGPTTASFDISPDIGAHGVNILSASPRWEVSILRRQAIEWQNVHWSESYTLQSGTSMAAPHVSGIVALLVNHNRITQPDNPISNYEIKTRIMNTATSLNYTGSNYGPFDGARQADVYAAANASAVVFAEFPMVTITPGQRWVYQTFAVTRKGAFSFGLVPAGGTQSLSATIRGIPGSTYLLSHEQNITARNAALGAILEHPSYVITDNYGYAVFEVSIKLPNDAIILSHHIGYVIVESHGDVVARIPYAALSFDDGSALQDVFLTRPVITSYANMVVPESRQIHINFTPMRGLRMRGFIYNKAPGEVEFSRALQSTYRMMRTANIREENLGLPHRGVIFFSPIMFDDISMPYAGEFQLRIDVYVEINTIFDPDPGGVDQIVPIFIFQETIVFPLHFDVEPPVISHVGAHVSHNDVSVTGHVFDEWMTHAISNNLTFDIWLEDPYISLERNLGAWVLVGENMPENRPVRATVDSDGYFSANIPGAQSLLPSVVTVWALDNYSVTPVVDRVVGAPTTAATNRMEETNYYFTPSGYVSAMPHLTEEGLIRTGLVWNPLGSPLPEEMTPLIDYYAWVGTNISSYHFFLTDGGDILSVPVSSILHIPPELSIDNLPFDLNNAAEIYPASAGEREIEWLLADSSPRGLVSLENGVLYSTGVGSVLLQAEILDGTYDEYNQPINFTMYFELELTPVAPPISNAFVYRPVISTAARTRHIGGEGLQPQAQLMWSAGQLNRSAGQLGLFYTPQRGFWLYPRIFKASEYINETNWHEPRFASYFMGTGRTLALNPETPNARLDMQHRGIVFDWQDFRNAQGRRVQYLPEGRYLLILDFYELHNGQKGASAASIILPFFVDNTPPSLNSLQFNGNEIPLENGIRIESPPFINEENPFIVSGNVSDAWTYTNNLAVWVLLGQNAGANIPHRADVDESGNFTVRLTSGGVPNPNFPESTITVWVVDGWKALPRYDHFIGNIIDRNGYVTTLRNDVNALPHITQGRFHPGEPSHGVHNITSLILRRSLQQGLIWGVATDGADSTNAAHFSNSGVNLANTFLAVLTK